MKVLTMNRRRAIPWIEGILLGILVGLLAMLLVVFLGSVTERPANKTGALIKTLQKACDSYRHDFGVYPPSTHGSQSLHHHLGIERVLMLPDADGTPRGIRKPPIIEFPPDWLKDGGGRIPDAALRPTFLVDSFENEIRYLNPGKRNKNGVDIWSPGPDGKDQMDPANPDFDDVTNWNPEY